MRQIKTKLSHLWIKLLQAQLSEQGGWQAIEGKALRGTSLSKHTNPSLLVQTGKRSDNPGLPGTEHKDAYGQH
jgi:hypothetical protein